jgi:hypothetical protein
LWYFPSLSEYTSLLEKEVSGLPMRRILTGN